MNEASLVRKNGAFTRPRGKLLFSIYDGGVVFCRVDRMAAWLIAVIGVVYLAVGIDLMMAGKTGLGIAFLGYSFSNVGLFIAAR